jgi:hypothetical protein
MVRLNKAIDTSSFKCLIVRQIVKEQAIDPQTILSKWTTMLSYLKFRGSGTDTQQNNLRQ